MHTGSNSVLRVFRTFIVWISKSLCIFLIQPVIIKLFVISRNMLITIWKYIAQKEVLKRRDFVQELKVIFIPRWCYFYTCDPRDYIIKNVGNVVTKPDRMKSRIRHLLLAIYVAF